MMMRDLSSRLPAADELLSALGLETRRSSSESLVSALAIFGAGVTVGVAVALLFAPKTGEEARAELGERMNRMRGEFGSRKESSGADA
jgi:hypothetical protein